MTRTHPGPGARSSFLSGARPALRSTLTPLRSYAATEVLEVSETGRALTVRLPTGHLAYYQRRPDQCMSAALATLLQLPIEEIPDPHIDKRLAAGDDPDTINRDANAELDAWLAERGRRLVKHARPPVRSAGWIGISPGDGRFGDHTLVMTMDRLAWDPASNWPAPPGYKVQNVYDVTHGMTVGPL